MKIVDREINSHTAPYVIAELSANHNGSLDRCMKLMQAAKRSGADAVKLQVYTAETITFPGAGDEFIIKDGPWKGRNLHDLYKDAQTPFEWIKPLMDYGRIIQIPVFASVFDLTSLELLERLGCPAYKIASFEIVDTPLIRAAAATGKPVIISTGMASHKEIKDAGNAFRFAAPDPSNLALLHCVSGYPTPASMSNLPELGPLSTLLGGKYVVGLSDHTLGIGVSIAAAAYGARIIEKHLTLDRKDGGPDAEFSMEPHEFKLLTTSVYEAWQAIQASVPKVQDAMRAYRRSLYVVADVAKGEPLTKENVRSIRPASGLAPSLYEEVLGKVANQDLKAGTPLSLSHFLTVV